MTPDTITFDWGMGEQTNLDLQALDWTKAPLYDAGRLRINQALWANSVLEILTGAELLAAMVLQNPPKIGASPAVTLGERRAAMLAISPEKPLPGFSTQGMAVARDAYFAVQSWARWIAPNIGPPRNIDPVFLPSLPTANATRLTEGAVGLAWTVGAIGVALAAVTAIAYWAGKREDAMASVAIETVKTGAALDTALKLALAQLAQTGAVDPKMYAVFQAAGAPREESSFTIPAVIGTGLVCTVGAGIAGFAFARRPG